MVLNYRKIALIWQSKTVKYQKIKLHIENFNPPISFHMPCNATVFFLTNHIFMGTLSFNINLYIVLPNIVQKFTHITALVTLDVFLKFSFFDIIKIG